MIGLIRLIFVCIISTLLVISCKEKECKCTMDNVVLYQNDSIITAIKKDNSLGIKNYWKRFDEPVFEDLNIEAYRLSITALLYDYQKIYRIERKGRKVNLYVKEYIVPTTIEHRNDSLIRDTMRSLTNLEWGEIKKSLDKNCFWAIASNTDREVLDGIIWLMEGFNPKKNSCTNLKYHFVNRVSPELSGFKNIGEQIIALDRLELKNFRSDN